MADTTTLRAQIEALRETDTDEGAYGYNKAISDVLALLAQVGAAEGDPRASREIMVSSCCGIEQQWHEWCLFYICPKCGNRNSSSRIVLAPPPEAARP